MNNIGINIANRRHKLKMTQEELSNLADISTNYVSRLERGEVEHMRAETLYKISKALDTSMESLIEGEKPAIHGQHSMGKYEKELKVLLSLLNQEDAEEVAKSVLNLIHTKPKEQQ